VFGLSYDVYEYVRDVFMKSVDLVEKLDSLLEYIGNYDDLCFDEYYILFVLREALLLLYDVLMSLKKAVEVVKMNCV